jgi:hypothetical protein
MGSMFLLAAAAALLYLARVPGYNASLIQLLLLLAAAAAV